MNNDPLTEEPINNRTAKPLMSRRERYVFLSLLLLVLFVGNIFGLLFVERKRRQRQRRKSMRSSQRKERQIKQRLISLDSPVFVKSVKRLSGGGNKRQRVRGGGDDDDVVVVVVVINPIIYILIFRERRCKVEGKDVRSDH